MDTMVDTTLQDGLHSLQGFSSELRWPNTQLPPTLRSNNAESFVPTHFVCTLHITFYHLSQVPVILFRTTVPTPFIPFTVMRRGAAAGVMVTASHNPRSFNSL